jgi:hypothetical protein
MLTRLPDCSSDLLWNRIRFRMGAVWSLGWTCDSFVHPGVRRGHVYLPNELAESERRGRRKERGRIGSAASVCAATTALSTIQAQVLQAFVAVEKCRVNISSESRSNRPATWTPVLKRTEEVCGAARSVAYEYPLPELWRYVSNRPFNTQPYWNSLYLL